MSLLSSLPIRIARRELRAGIRGWRIFLLCLIVGVGTITLVQVTANGITDSLHANGRTLLGGDLAIRATTPLAEGPKVWLAAHGAKRMESIELRSMVRDNGTGENAQLVEIKAVESGYPFYGEATVTDLDDHPITTPLKTLLGPPLMDAPFRAVAERSLFERFNAKIGDVLSLGNGHVQLVGVLAHEPDKIGSASIGFGPRLMIGKDTLDPLGLIVPGALVYHHTKIALPAGSDVAAAEQALESAFPDLGRLRSYQNASPQLERFLNRLTQFLTLIGLTALLVGGIGIGQSVRGWLDSRLNTLATLKTLGAPGRLIFQSAMAQVLMLAALGTAIGLLIGGGLPYLLGPFLEKALQMPLELHFSMHAFIVASAFGLLTAFTFSTWPIAQAQETRPQDLFRDAILPNRMRPRRPYILLALLGGVALVALAFQLSSDTRLTFWFLLGAALTFLLFRLLAVGILKLLATMPRPRDITRRLALSSLIRPGNTTASILLSLGLGLTVLTSIALVQGNFHRTLSETRNSETPAFFFLDLLTDQRDALSAAIKAVPGSGEVKFSPWLRGRLVAVNGRPAEEAIKDRSQEWVLKSDRGISYTNELPAHSVLTAGEWWGADYAGPPKLSVVKEVADAFNIGVGDEITVNLMGRDITLPVANIRQVEWTSLTMNFTFLYSPGLLENAPHTWLATAQAKPEAEEAIQRLVARDFRNVTIVRLSDALKTINDVLGQIDLAVAVIGGVALITGMLVLVGAMLSTLRQRRYEAVLMKMLGAGRRHLLRAYLMEYTLLGLASSLLAAGLGVAASWGIVAKLMHLPWHFLPGTLLATLPPSILLVLVFGYLSTWRLLRVKPAPHLRTE